MYKNELDVIEQHNWTEGSKYIQLIKMNMETNGNHSHQIISLFNINFDVKNGIKFFVVFKTVFITMGNTICIPRKC